VLILGRRPGESIVIGDGIRVVVISCDRGGVRLGIEAPPEVTILRGEIAKAVADVNRAATVTDAKDWVERLKG
jgi:carbon storage regulator CsrA